MGGEIPRINGIAGTDPVIRRERDVPVETPVATPAAPPAAARAVPARDVVVAADAPVAAPPSTVAPDWAARVSALEAELAAQRQETVALATRVQETERAERAEKAEAAKAQREEGWLMKALTDLAVLFLRMFFPIINLISLGVRLARIAYKKFIKGEDIDWKREGMLLLADLAGCAPMVGMLAGPVGFLGGATLGGVISAGVHGAVKVTSEDKDDMLGWEKDQPSGLRIAWEKAKGFTTDTYAAVTGRERPSEAAETTRTGIETRPIRAGDVPVS